MRGVWQYRSPPESARDPTRFVEPLLRPAWHSMRSSGRSIQSSTTSEPSMRPISPSAGWSRLSLLQGLQGPMNCFAHCCGAVVSGQARFGQELQQQRGAFLRPLKLQKVGGFRHEVVVDP